MQVFAFARGRAVHALEEVLFARIHAALHDYTMKITETLMLLAATKVRTHTVFHGLVAVHVHTIVTGARRFLFWIVRA